jgi:hypothetical protein
MVGFCDPYHPGCGVSKVQRPFAAKSESWGTHEDGNQNKCHDHKMPFCHFKPSKHKYQNFQPFEDCFYKFLIDTGVVSRGRRQEGLKFVRRKYIKARQQAAGKPLEQGTEGRKKQQRPEEKISGSLGHYQPSHLRFTIYKVPRA